MGFRRFYRAVAAFFMGFFQMRCFALPVILGLFASSAIAQVSAQLCGTAVVPKTELQAYTDAGVTTRVWRDQVNACGVPLTVMFWHQADVNHWMMTVQRPVANLLARRLPPVAINAVLLDNGKRANMSSGGVINGALSEFQFAYAENRELQARKLPEQLKVAKLVPPVAMFQAAKKPVFIDSNYNVRPFTSLKDGTLTRAMPMTGERGDIGVVHEWCSAWLSYGTPYWWTACMDAAKDHSNIPWHVLYQGKPLLFDASAMRKVGYDPRNPPGTILALPEAPFKQRQWQGDGAARKFVETSVDDKWTLDGAHEPFALLAPYMATRHPYFLYLAQFQFGVQLGGLTVGFDYGERPKYPLPTILSDQERGVAWSLRTMSQTVLMTPDKVPDWLHPKAELKPLLSASISRWGAHWKTKRDYWQKLKDGTAGNTIPIEGKTLIKATGKEAYANQLWMTEYMGQSLGFVKWAGVAEVEPLYGYTRDILLARFGTGSPYRVLGGTFTTVFSNPKTGALARNLADVVQFTPAENITYGSNKPLVVGTNGNIGQWTEMDWQIQGALALCVLNGDTRCTEPLRWWETQAARLGDWQFDKYRMGY
jgi:hypothetical protein